MVSWCLLNQSRNHQEVYVWPQTVHEYMLWAGGFIIIDGTQGMSSNIILPLGKREHKFNCHRILKLNHQRIFFCYK